MVELSQDAVLRVPEEARKILPSHAQQATIYFSGGDFLISPPLGADTRFAEHFDEPMTGAEIEISWRTFTGARARAKRAMTTRPVMRPYAAMLVAAGILSAVGCVTPAARPAGYDPTTMDPPSIDPSYPPSMEPAAITSHGARLNGIIYVAQGSAPHPTAILLHGYPGNERNLDLAHAMRRAGWNVVFFRYRGSWGSGGTFSMANALEDVQEVVGFLKRPESRLIEWILRGLPVRATAGGF